MRDEDFVLGLVLSGQARAYPWWIAKNHHVVNDTVAGVPVTVAFCEQCTGGAAFARTVGGRVLSFAVAGVYNGTIVIKDRETGTLWAPFSGKGLEGPLAGRTLERIPVCSATGTSGRRAIPRPRSPGLRTRAAPATAPGTRRGSGGS